MREIKFDIRPNYRSKTLIQSILIVIGVLMIFYSLFTNDGGLYVFLGFIVVIIDIIFAVFSHRRTLIINEDGVSFNSNHLIKGFGEEFKLLFEEIEDIDFAKGKILWLGGRNPIADADVQTLHSVTRIICQFLK